MGYVRPYRWLRMAAVVIVVGLVAGCGTGRTGTSANGPSPTAEASVLAAPSGLPSNVVEEPGHDDHGPEVPVPPVAQARPVAAAFAAAWARPDLPADRWRAGVASLCEPGFAAALRTVDPAMLPARVVTGAPVPVQEPADGPAVYTVATDGGVLTVTVAAVDGRWLVASNDFERTVS